MKRNRSIIVVIFLAAALLSACNTSGETHGSTVDWTRHVLTLKDFWDDPTLAADPRNLVAVTFREAPDWVRLPQEDDGDGIATVPYHLDRATTLGFDWIGPGEQAGAHALVKDSEGNQLVYMEPESRGASVTLPPGTYSIQIFRPDKTDRSPVYIQPEPDVDEPLFDPSITPYPDRLIFRSGSCPDCNLSGGNLFQALMKGNDLARANMSGTNLFQADLQGSSMPGAMLDGANLYQSLLASADLKQTSLAGANVFQADFSDAGLAEAVMPGINAPESCFVRADLQNADISGAVLGFVNAVQADFSGANLKGTILKYSDLTQAVFCGADLSEADLTGAIVSEADFSGADLWGATWIDGTRCRGRTVDTCQ